MIAALAAAVPRLRIGSIVAGNTYRHPAVLAKMATTIDSSALLVYRAAWTKDAGAGRVTREAAMAKLYATEAAQRVIDAAAKDARQRDQVQRAHLRDGVVG